MVIEPRVRGFICTTAHPVGCARAVEEQIALVRSRGGFTGPRCALVVGASTGYGLATRIAAAFGAGAGTVGVFLERPAEGKRTATAGWYNSAAFEQAARGAGLPAASVNGDAFAAETKAEAVRALRERLGPADLVVYSVAAPRRVDPVSGRILKSTLKPIGRPYTQKSVDAERGAVGEVTIEPATEEEIADTVGVMGGEDWVAWIDALDDAGVLAPGATTLAYSYIGPALTHAIYRQGTIGRAKDHLESTARALDARLGRAGGRALIAVNTAIVTQSSAAIPVVPLYMSLLFRVMKARGLHEGAIEQMDRLFREHLYAGTPVPLDEAGRVRLDDREMRADVQAEIAARWGDLRSDSLQALVDLDGYRAQFLRLFGFGVPGVDYAADVDPAVPVPSLG